LFLKSISKFYKNSVNLLINCGLHPDDSLEIKLQKQILSLLPIIIGIAAVFWGGIYFMLGHYLSASIPLSYSVISAVSLAYFSYSKNITFLRFSQLLLVLILPFLLMWSLGGFAAGSYVMIWAFYAPLSLMSFSRKDSVTWMLLFLFLTVVSFLIDEMLIENVKTLPDFAIRVFSLLNIVAGFGGIFYIIHHYVKERDHISEEQSKSEARLQKEKQKAELLTEEQSSMLSLFDKGDSVLFKCKNNDIWSVEYVSLSVSRLLGYDIEDFTSKRLDYATFIHREDLTQVLLEVNLMIENSLDFFKHKPYRVITKDGNIKWVLDYTVTQKDAHGNITHFIGYISDITEIKNIQKELEQAKDNSEKANRSKSEFLANMSHEIRTPLNAIMGFIGILKEEEVDTKKLQYLETIDSSSKSLTNIINDILDFTKLESGKLDVEYIDFNPELELKSLEELFKIKCENKNINLQMKLKGLPSSLNGDILRIKQVLNNLLSNAIKFTESDKKIIMDVSYDNNHLHISVKDEGIGIDEEHQEKIFQSFSQADNSTTRKYGGTGLGLSISHNLIKLMGGELKVKSSIGNGSEFYFSIPLQIGKVIDNKVNTEKNIDCSQYKLLLVEDNKPNQLFMKVVFQKLNINFDIANDGIEAIKLFKTNKYDVILMDENMPNMNGIEATKNILLIEKERNLEHTPIIALTANALKGDRERFLEAGMDEYLSKPINKNILSEKLNEVLA